MDSRARSFDAFPIIVGRSAACEYSLSDESRYISSNHAVVSLEKGQLLIQDTSANGVYINGASTPIGRGLSAALNDNDTLAIGDYTLTVTVELLAPPVPADDPFALAGIEQSAQPQAPRVFDPFKGDEQDWAPSSEQTGEGFDDDWAITDTPTPSPANEPGPDQGDWDDWIDDLPAKSRKEPSDGTGHGPIESNSLPDENNDWFSDPSSETISIPPSIAQNNANNRTRNPQRPQEHRSEDRLPPRLGPHQTTPASSHSNAAAHPFARSLTPQPQGQNLGSGASLETLLKAAALRESDFSQCNDTEVLAQTGRLLAHMVDAMMVLLQSRSEIKNAIRSDVTTLSRSDNNPLKFSFSAADALTKLLINNTDGYMQADKAIQEAVDDLKLHQLAMLDGMKAAVRSMLLEFDPDKLSKKLEKKGGISANIPITRDAKLWELFCEQYDAIHDEAVSDFSEMFGTEFRKAYEKRIRQLGRSPDF